MSAKDELIDALDRLAKVVTIELALLDDWSNDGATTAGRRAQIRLTSNYIGTGFSSAQRRTAHALNEARALAEGAVAHPPGDAHLRAVQAAVDSIADRIEWPGPALSDDSFTRATDMARANSDGAADTAEAIYTDCVHPGPQGVPPGGHPALVAPQPEMVAMVAAVRRPPRQPGRGRGKATGKTGTPKKPRKTSPPKKPAGGGGGIPASGPPK